MCRYYICITTKLPSVQNSHNKYDWKISILDKLVLVCEVERNAHLIKFALKMAYS